MPKRRQKAGKGKKARAPGRQRSLVAPIGIDQSSATTQSSTAESSEVEEVSSDESSPHICSPKCFEPFTTTADCETDTGSMKEKCEAGPCQHSNFPKSSLKEIIGFYESKMEKCKLAGAKDDDHALLVTSEFLDSLKMLHLDPTDEDVSFSHKFTDEMLVMIKNNCPITNEERAIIEDFEKALSDANFVRELAGSNCLQHPDGTINERVKQLAKEALARMKKCSQAMVAATDEEETARPSADPPRGCIVKKAEESSSEAAKCIAEWDTEGFHHHVVTTGCETCRAFPASPLFQTCLAKPFFSDRLYNGLGFSGPRPKVQFIRIIQFSTREDRKRRGICALQAVVIDFINPDELTDFHIWLSYTQGFTHTVRMGDESDEAWHCRVQLCSKPYPWRTMDYKKMADEIDEIRDPFFNAFVNVKCATSIKRFLDITSLTDRGYKRIGPVPIPAVSFHTNLAALKDWKPARVTNDDVVHNEVVHNDDQPRFSGVRLPRY